MEMKASESEFVVGVGNKFANLKPLPIRQILCLKQYKYKYKYKCKFEIKMEG